MEIDQNISKHRLFLLSKEDAINTVFEKLGVLFRLILSASHNNVMEYIKEKGALPECLTMSLAAYIAFFSNDIQSLTDAGLVCKRPAGNEYTVSDDRWVLEFYNDHKDASAEELVHAVLTNEKMWDQDLTQIEGLEAKVAADLKLIREKGAKAAYASCL